MRRKFQVENFSDIWQSAHRHRTDDLRTWLTRFLAGRLRLAWSRLVLQRQQSRSAVTTSMTMKIHDPASRTTESGK